MIVHKIGGAHAQCMNNYYTKFKYYGMQIVGVTEYTKQTPSKHFTEKNSKLKTPKMKKNSWNVYKIGGAHVQCVNNHYAKFEKKEIKTVEVTQITQSRHHLSIFGRKNVYVQQP